VVDAALGVDLGLVLAGRVGELGAREDVEVVVGRVAARVALGADGGAEDDQVLGDAWVTGVSKFFFPLLLLFYSFLFLVSRIHTCVGANPGEGGSGSGEG
jgi:hypothetical protein